LSICYLSNTKKVENISVYCSHFANLVKWKKKSYDEQLYATRGLMTFLVRKLTLKKVVHSILLGRAFFLFRRPIITRSNWFCRATLQFYSSLFYGNWSKINCENFCFLNLCLIMMMSGTVYMTRENDNVKKLSIFLSTYNFSSSNSLLYYASDESSYQQRFWLNYHLLTKNKKEKKANNLWLNKLNLVTKFICEEAKFKLVRGSGFINLNV
jgi:hypothetical protein